MSEDNVTTPAVETAPVVATPVVPAPVSVTAAPSKKVGLSELLIPISIVLAGIFVGAGLYLSGGGLAPKNAQVALTNPNQQQQPEVDTTNKIDPITEKDHVLGDSKAPVKIVEYSDFECPFCKKNHETLKLITAKYGNKVAWVYRQFPIEQLHSKAPKVAMASECVAELGGNDAFWKFHDAYFTQTLSNNRTDIETLLPKIIATIGIDKKAYDDCVTSGRHQDVIDANMADAAETGGRGTPWVIIVGPNGKTYPVNGAQPQAMIEKTIDTALGSSK
jgi:protein-disulfide isomerase